jgi:putative transposase
VDATAGCHWLCQCCLMIGGLQASPSAGRSARVDVFLLQTSAVTYERCVAGALGRSIDEAGHECEIRLAAFVFMPEHVHLLVVPANLEPAIGRYLARIKQPFSKWVKEQLTETRSRLIVRLTVQERPGKTCFRIWQESPGYDRNLMTPAVIEAAVEYIHMNPARRGLVKRAVDWKWSSASWYLLDQPRQRLPGLPMVYGLPAGTFDR